VNIRWQLFPYPGGQCFGQALHKSAITPVTRESVIMAETVRSLARSTSSSEMVFARPSDAALFGADTVRASLAAVPLVASFLVPDNSSDVALHVPDASMYDLAHTIIAESVSESTISPDRRRECEATHANNTLTTGQSKEATDEPCIGDPGTHEP